MRTTITTLVGYSMNYRISVILSFFTLIINIALIISKPIQQKMILYILDFRVDLKHQSSI